MSKLNKEILKIAMFKIYCDNTNLTKEQFLADLPKFEINIIQFVDPNNSGSNKKRLSYDEIFNNHDDSNLNFKGIFINVFKEIRVNQEYLDNSIFINFFVKMVRELWYHIALQTYINEKVATEFIRIVNQVTRENYMFSCCSPKGKSQPHEINENEYSCFRAISHYEGQLDSKKPRIIMFDTISSDNAEINSEHLINIIESLDNNKPVICATSQKIINPIPLNFSNYDTLVINTDQMNLKGGFYTKYISTKKKYLALKKLKI